MSDTIEFSSHCNHDEFHCTECDTYSIMDPGEPTDTCPNCDSDDFEELGEAPDCPCIGDNHEFAQEIWETWTDKHPAPYGWYICDGSGLGWQNRSGLKPLRADFDNILEEFSLDTDWTMDFPSLEIARTSDEFHISRYHHDSPMGESIDIKPADFEETLWCIEWADEMADYWIDAIQDLMNREYEVGMLDDEKVIEICEKVDLDPRDFLQNPEKHGFAEDID